MLIEKTNLCMIIHPWVRFIPLELVEDKKMSVEEVGCIVGKKECKIARTKSFRKKSIEALS